MTESPKMNTHKTIWSARFTKWTMPSCSWETTTSLRSTTWSNSTMIKSTKCARNTTRTDLSLKLEMLKSPSRTLNAAIINNRTPRRANNNTKKLQHLKIWWRCSLFRSWWIKASSLRQWISWIKQWARRTSLSRSCRGSKRRSRMRRISSLTLRMKRNLECHHQLPPGLTVSSPLHQTAASRWRMREVSWISPRIEMSSKINYRFPPKPCR